jgi:hypothetical protein
MSPQKKLPLKVRYTRAKFRHLASPLLWFPLGIICLLGVFIWELSVNPELLEEELAGENGETGEELSAAEISAIAADIDSSEFLLQELESNAPKKQPIALPKAILEDYIDENGRTLTLLEKTERELYSIYEKIGREESTGILTGENPNNNSLLNLGTTPETGESSAQGINNRLPPPSFNLSSPENLRENRQNRRRPLEAAMQEYLDSDDSRDDRQRGNYNSQLYESQEDLRRDSANFPINNSQSSGPLPNNPNYSSPGVGINSEDRPYYIDRSSGYGNNQNQPYYTNFNGNQTLETPQNQPYYNNNSWQSQPTQINVPNLVPVVPNNTNLPSNPYSRNSGNYPYSANQGDPQLQQNQVNNGANYYQRNNGATQQPQPYNNSQSNPFNRRFGEQNDPFNNR